MHSGLMTPRAIYMLASLSLISGIFYFLPSIDARHDGPVTFTSVAVLHASIINFSNLPAPSRIANPALHLEEQPPTNSFPDSFRETGVRAQILGELLREAGATEAIDRFGASLFTFLAQDADSTNPTLTSLQSSITPGSAGIALTVGDNDVRSAAHLLASIRHVLHSKLPVQIVYAGDDGLSPDNRALLVELVGPTRPDLEFLDLFSVFDEASLVLQSPGGSEALKPFAVLCSTLEQVVFIDVDTVFFQKPEILLENPEFEQTGALLFGSGHLQPESVMEEELNETRLQQRQSRRNATSLESQAQTQRDNVDVVVIDKSQIDVLMGLLHICWQNSHGVHEEDGHRTVYESQPSWWLGFELAGVLFGAESRKAVALVSESELVSAQNTDSFDPCDLTIGHIDEEAKLIWCERSLLTSMLLSGTEKAAETGDRRSAVVENCLVKEPTHMLTSMEVMILEDSWAEAQRIENSFSIQEN